MAMGSRENGDTDSPSASSLFLPLKRRRGSVASIASQVDKETLNQALDSIHNAASQSDTLTTFNEYTSPPQSSAGQDGKGITSELQGGISGLYSRLKASVAAPRDQAPGSETIDDTSSSRSSKLMNSTSSLPPRNILGPGAQTTSPAPASPVVSRDTSSMDYMNESQQSLSNAPPKQTSQQERSRAGTDVSMVSTAASKRKSLVGASRASLGPSTQKIAEPTVAGVTVNATKSTDSQEKLPNDIDSSKVPVTPTSPFIPLVEKPKSHLAQERLEATAQAASGSRSTSLLSRKTPIATPSDAMSPSEEGEGASYFPESSKVIDAEADAKSQSEPTVGVTGPKASNDTLAKTTKDINKSPTPQTESRPRPIPIVHQPERRDSTPDNFSKRRLPDTRSSQASMRGDEAGNGTRRSAASYQIGSDEEALHTVGKLPSKSKPLSRTSSTGRGLNVVLTQFKNKVLSKEYWMRDENAKDCFYCGDTFSTFRRKHHCRTCGQIFDAKCTVLISGTPFGQSGTLRVCKPCENIINGGDDSSEYSDDGSIMGTGLRPRHGSSGTADLSPARSFTSLRTAYADNRGDGVPSMAIPAARKVKDNSRKRQDVLEIDFEPKSQLARPGSSRSLKSSSGIRAHPLGHRRHHSRSLLGRSMKPAFEDVAPFHTTSTDAQHSESRLPAFHSDNVIDPELADFMSDEESSADEQAGIMATLSGEASRGADADGRSIVSGLFAQQKKNRSRRGDKSLNGFYLGGRDTDSASLNSARLGSARPNKRRNFSISSNSHLRGSPRGHKFSALSPGSLPADPVDSEPASLNEQFDSPGGLRITRSSAMKGPDAPAVELNNASIQHVRKLLSQLLKDFRVPDLEGWEKALLPILLRATDDVTPNVQNGDDIDIRHYVKLKKIPGGRPGDTSYVSGLVFSKNLALKSMPRTIPHPNILILTFPVEYSRHKQHFMSLDLLIRQEREYLQNLVHRIAALRPHLLLCQKNISGLALGFLDKAGIATAYNVKPSVLEAISRCAQTRIINSIDKLAIKPAQAGRCASFYLKTYVHNGRKKTYMYLSGCPKELGCTIVLRGANSTDLRSIKRITEFMIYVVYNLKLETSFMRDEFALIPSYTGSGTIASDKETKTSTEYVETKRSIAADVLKTTSDQAGPGYEERKDPEMHRTGLDGNGNTVPIPTLKTVGTTDSDDIPDDIPMPTFYGDMVEQYKDKVLSISPFVRFMQPYLLIKAREQERRLVYLKRLLDQELEQQDSSDNGPPAPEKFSLITPDMIHETYEGTSKQVREVLRAAQYAEYDKAVHNYRTQKKQWESYVTSNDNMFDPLNHQSITVLYSVVCMATSVPCSGPDLLALSYYNEHDSGEAFEVDCTLGQYVEDICFGAHGVCFSNGCERRMYEHHRQYVHGAAQLSVTVEPHPARLRGYQDIILMWSACRICGNETQVMPMSENTWKYSFGKYLELTFWSHDLHARAGLCSHDLHRNHLRYFGFKNMAIRMQYDSINLLEIVVPRTRITWKVVNDLNFKNEVFNRADERVNNFMNSVKQRLQGINIDSVPADKAVACKEELDHLKKKANDDHTFLKNKLQAKYTGSKYFEVVPLNRAIRATQEKVAEWDRAFIDFDRDFFPSDRDIRRLTALQFKKLFLDRDESVASLTSNEDGEIPLIEKDPGEKISPEDTPTLTPMTRNLSPEQTRDMLTAVVEGHHAANTAKTTDAAEEADEDVTTPRADTNNTNILTIAEVTEAANGGATVSPTEAEDVRHLDLAVSVSHNSPPKTLFSPQSRPSSPTMTRSYLSPIVDRTESMDAEDSGTTANLGSPPPTKVLTSGIPRPSEARTRRSGPGRSPPLIRTQSQPAHIRRVNSSTNAADLHTARTTANGSTSPRISKDAGKAATADKPDRKFAERIGLSALKSGTSMIPRSIAARGKSTKVSTLAKHFEQLTREFEKERLRDRKQRAARTRQARAFPMKHAKPVIEVYRNVHEAVEERETSDDSSPETPRQSDDEQEHTMAEIMAQNTVNQTSGDGFHAERSVAHASPADTAEIEVGDSQPPISRAESDIDMEGLRSDDEPSMIDLTQIPDAQHILSPSEAQLDLKLDLPKHEKNSLMKLMTNFWAERSASGWQSLEYPLRAIDHIFADSDIIIREDEPSSLIAFALDSRDYKEKIESIKAKKEGSNVSHDKEYAEDLYLNTDEQKLIERSLRRETGVHLKYQFSEGSAKMLCKVFYAEQFDAVRRKCGVEDRIIDCLSRCLKWDSKGGKTKSVFLKTLDDRLVLKSLSPVETQAFLKFAPSYFELMGEALFHDLPSVIAKMLGFYQVIIKNPATGTDFNWYVLVMENLFYDRNPTRIFDLKGSMRNRRINVTGEQNEVLLDENMVEFIYESPLFVREHSKRLMRASVYNDTLFLARQNVMDYSLMVAIDGNRQELVVGIIDCIRTYTWDKKLESWMKDRGKNRPTVTSPKEYKNRFREAMNRYVLLAPNCWQQTYAQSAAIKSESMPQTQEQPQEDIQETQEGDIEEFPGHLSQVASA